ncbi:MAG: hypothetical protein KatS3mg082_2431 [Nitrospiraceae bacterium]|nr:MAG: hypothetical protein KatS3mg082_2431 [Nitrospiraceae bacterium]
MINRPKPLLESFQHVYNRYGSHHALAECSGQSIVAKP